ncbi:MAG TPA: hypothetical protein IAB01_00590 [Candidatus Avidesulfovibrio excrementigallinarum]|nr:hypothetical protein [Candidatus Avidesulfovibrio excrementigallinarum]
MPSRDMENLTAFLQHMLAGLSEENASTLTIVCANLQALTEQVRMLEEMPLPAES